MVTQYDDKGKIFTQVVSKEPIQVTIQTNTNTIQGTMHIHKGMRIKDELNGDERFIAVTNAVIYNERKEEIYRSEFIAINIDQIVWLIPDENYP